MVGSGRAGINDSKSLSIHEGNMNSIFMHSGFGEGSVEYQKEGSGFDCVGEMEEIE